MAPLPPVAMPPEVIKRILASPDFKKMATQYMTGQETLALNDISAKLPGLTQAEKDRLFNEFKSTSDAMDELRTKMEDKLMGDISNSPEVQTAIRGKMLDKSGDKALYKELIDKKFISDADPEPVRPGYEKGTFEEYKLSRITSKVEGAYLEDADKLMKEKFKELDVMVKARLTEKLTPAPVVFPDTKAPPRPEVPARER